MLRHMLTRAERELIQNTEHRQSLNKAGAELKQRAELRQSLDRAYTEVIQSTEHRQRLNNANTEHRERADLRQTWTELTQSLYRAQS